MVDIELISLHVYYRMFYQHNFGFSAEAIYINVTGNMFFYVAFRVNCSMDVLSNILSAFPTSNPSRRWNSLTYENSFNN